MDIQKDVHEFNNMIGVPRKVKARRLSMERYVFATVALTEELNEFEESGTFDDDVDALVDLIYFAVGRLDEMGVDFHDAWNQVHAANMRKKPGVTKRGAACDATKPEGWIAPNHTYQMDQLAWKPGPSTEVPKSFTEAAQLCNRKAQDYNSGVTRDEYFPFGFPSYVHMIWTKVLRLRSFAEQPRESNFEGVRDTGLDLLNYVGFMMDAIDQGKIDVSGNKDKQTPDTTEQTGCVAGEADVRREETEEC